MPKRSHRHLSSTSTVKLAEHSSTVSPSAPQPNEQQTAVPVPRLQAVPFVIVLDLAQSDPHRLCPYSQEFVFNSDASRFNPAPPNLENYLPDILQRFQQAWDNRTFDAELRHCVLLVGSTCYSEGTAIPDEHLPGLQEHFNHFVDILEDGPASLLLNDLPGLHLWAVSFPHQAVHLVPIVQLACAAFCLTNSFDIDDISLPLLERDVSPLSEPPAPKALDEERGSQACQKAQDLLTNHNRKYLQSVLHRILQNNPPKAEGQREAESVNALLQQFRFQIRVAGMDQVGVLGYPKKSAWVGVTEEGQEFPIKQPSDVEVATIPDDPDVEFEQARKRAISRFRDRLAQLRGTEQKTRKEKIKIRDEINHNKRKLGVALCHSQHGQRIRVNIQVVSNTFQLVTTDSSASQVFAGQDVPELDVFVA